MFRRVSLANPDKRRLVVLECIERNKTLTLHVVIVGYGRPLKSGVIGQKLKCAAQQTVCTGRVQTAN